MNALRLQNTSIYDDSNDAKFTRNSNLQFSKQGMLGEMVSIRIQIMLILAYLLDRPLIG